MRVLCGGFAVELLAWGNDECHTSFTTSSTTQGNGPDRRSDAGLGDLESDPSGNKPPRSLEQQAAELDVAAAAVAAWRCDQIVRVRSVLGYRVRKAPVDLVRLLWFVLRGHGRWIGKAWTYCTYGDLRADARTARLAGDAEARRAAQEMIRADSRARWSRLGMVTERIWKGAGLAGALVLALWLIDSMMTRAQMWPWLAGVYGVIGWAWSVAKTVVPVVVVAAPAGWLVATAYEGRDKAPGAGFLVRPDREDADSWIDERMISQALAHLGIAPLDKFFKDGGQLLYTVPARLDGNGTYAQIRLPMGATADMVADRRPPGVLLPCRELVGCGVLPPAA